MCFRLREEQSKGRGGGGGGQWAQLRPECLGRREEGGEVAGASSCKPWGLLVIVLAFTLNKWTVLEE